MARRYIFISDPDPSELLDELHHEGDRGPRGLPLGNLSQHIKDRLTNSFFVLCLAERMSAAGLLHGNMATVFSQASVAISHSGTGMRSVASADITSQDGARVSITQRGAHAQDKRATRETPAAHVVPCDLYVETDDPSRRPARTEPKLYHYLLNDLNRTWVELNVFGYTNRVHRLTNVADRRCEAGPEGYGSVLVQATAEAVAGAKSARGAFGDTLLPGYEQAAHLTLQRLEQAFTQFEREAVDAAQLLDPYGNPLTPRPRDTRLGSPNRDAVAANKGVLRQILRDYATPQSHVSEDALHDAEGKVDALMRNERYR